MSNMVSVHESLKGQLLPLKTAPKDTYSASSSNFNKFKEGSDKTKQRLAFSPDDRKTESTLSSKFLSDLQGLTLN